MKPLRFELLFWLLMGLSITARNQDSRNMESESESVFMVKAVYVDSDGVKWFGTNRGLCRYDNLTWKYYTESDHLVGNQVNALAFEHSGSGSELWVATTKGVSVVSFDPAGVTGSASFTTEDGLLDNDVADIAIDSYHGKFFGSESGVTWFHGGAMDSITYSDYPLSMVDAPVRKMDMYNDTLYIAADGGIGRFVSGVDGISGATRWTSEYGVTPYSGNIHSVKVDAGSNQWFGTDVGVEKHTGYDEQQNWSIYGAIDGLVNDHVITIAEDLEGGMWFGTLGGVSSFIDGLWTSYTTADGLLNDTVYDIDFDVDRSVWLATGAGACRLQNGEFTNFYTDVPGKLASSMEMQLYFSRASETIYLSYRLTDHVPVVARLYNMSGMLVGQWNDLPALAGEHRVEIPLSGNIAGPHNGGFYVLQLRQGNRADSRKLVIEK